MHMRRALSILLRSFVPLDRASSWATTGELVFRLIATGTTGSLVGAVVGLYKGVVSGVMGGIATFAVILFILIWREAYRLQTKIEEYRRRAVPEITFSRTKVFSQGVVTVAPTSGISPTGASLFFGSVYVVNTSREVDALDVVAEITYEVAGRAPLSTYGRWGGDTEQPATLDPLTPLDHLRRTNLLANGEEHQLDLLCKDPRDADLYAYSNESQRAPDMKPPEYQMGTGPVRVQVKLMGRGMPDLIRNLEAQSEGVGKAFKLQQLPPP